MHDRVVGDSAGEPVGNESPGHAVRANLRKRGRWRNIPSRAPIEATGAALNQAGTADGQRPYARIYDVSVHTSRVCHQIGLWDGIKRDRLNWAYDIYLAAKTEYSLWDDYSVLKRSLRELGRTPYGYWMNNLPPIRCGGSAAYGITTSRRETGNSYGKSGRICGGISLG